MDLKGGYCLTSLSEAIKKIGMAPFGGRPEACEGNLWEGARKHSEEARRHLKEGYRCLKPLEKVREGARKHSEGARRDLKGRYCLTSLSEPIENLCDVTRKHAEATI